MADKMNFSDEETEETKPADHNEFELMLRILGNELVAIRLAAHNFSGKMIVWSILLLFFTFMIMEVFGLSAWLGLPQDVYIEE